MLKRRSLSSRLALAVLLAASLAILASCHGFFSKPVLKSISISPSGASIVKSTGTQQFTASGVNDDGSTSNASVTWSIASCDSTIDASGLVTAGPTAGTCTITATLNSDTSKTATASLTITNSALSSIAVTPATPNPVPSTTTTTSDQMTAKGTYADNSTADITSSVTWTSSDTVNAPVSASGLVTISANAPAEQVTITATSGSIQGSTTIQIQ